jgi:Na+(H+)/acetate symporter ActP
MSEKYKPEKHTSAKNKLNAAHFLGCTLLSGLIGLVSESFVVFLVALAASLAAAYHAGNIRR